VVLYKTVNGNAVRSTSSDARVVTCEGASRIGPVAYTARRIAVTLSARSRQRLLPASVNVCPSTSKLAYRREGELKLVTGKFDAQCMPLARSTGSFTP